MKLIALPERLGHGACLDRPFVRARGLFIQLCAPTLAQSANATKILIIVERMQVYYFLAVLSNVGCFDILFIEKFGSSILFECNLVV